MKSRVLTRIICCGLYPERDPFLSEALYVPVQADLQPVSILERLIESVSDESKSQSIGNSESSIRHREAGAWIFLILFYFIVFATGEAHGQSRRVTKVPRRAKPLRRRTGTKIRQTREGPIKCFCSNIKVKSKDSLQPLATVGSKSSSLQEAMMRPTRASTPRNAEAGGFRVCAGEGLICCVISRVLAVW